MSGNHEVTFSKIITRNRDEAYKANAADPGCKFRQEDKEEWAFIIALFAQDTRYCVTL